MFLIIDVGGIILGWIFWVIIGFLLTSVFKIIGFIIITPFKLLSKLNNTQPKFKTSPTEKQMKYIMSHKAVAPPLPIHKTKKSKYGNYVLLNKKGELYYK